jgi:hypothetical protein
MAAMPSQDSTEWAAAPTGLNSIAQAPREMIRPSLQDPRPVAYPGLFDHNKGPRMLVASQAAVACTVEQFCGLERSALLDQLDRFIPDAGAPQRRAWIDQIKHLRKAFDQLVPENPAVATWGVILEYLVPMEQRRIDVVVLTPNLALVLEFKGSSSPTVAAIDQALGYARDLNAYHRTCASVAAWPILVLTQAGDLMIERDRLTICGPERLAWPIMERAGAGVHAVGALERFLDEAAYQPLPSLVAAARVLFAREQLPAIKRAHAATDPAVQQIARVAHECARSRKRSLVLVTGVPGAGKTLVGLRTAHAAYLDDLAVERAGGKPTAPAVFLSGNGPLVQVLQHALVDGGGDGKAFVRDVKAYVRLYSRPNATPPEHVIIYDEAQRAWDATQVTAKHQSANAPTGRSEPDLFVEFAGRIPEWSVLVGLIGTGQEIHVGEEGGIEQWAIALSKLEAKAAWQVHVPPRLARVFASSGVPVHVSEALDLDEELRFHGASTLHEWVAHTLNDGQAAGKPFARDMAAAGLRLYVTRDLELARSYVRDRYEGMTQHRYGMLASSKDKDLVRFGVFNDFQTTKRLKVGPWYNAAPRDELSCCQLETVATEFAAQGLELDFAIVAWGSDFIRVDGAWSSARARGSMGHVKDPHQLRRNSYRVLLTRGRDGSVIYLPDERAFDETFAHLVASGAHTLEAATEWVATAMA